MPMHLLLSGVHVSTDHPESSVARDPKYAR